MSASTPKINISRFKGDTYRIAFKLTSNRLPMDLTDKILTMSAIEASRMGTDDYLFQVEGVPIGLAADGLIGFTLSPEQAGQKGTFLYGVKMESGETSRTIFHGNITFEQDI
jgi:hypothetical protein